MAILVSDLLKKLDAVPMSVIEDMGEELKTVQKGIKNEDVLIGFNLAVTICNKYLGSEHDGNSDKLGKVDA